jgi:hypothetical protein
MLKNRADKDTILFVLNDTKAIGYNINFYKTGQIVNNINPKKIFYKMGDTSDTWIDYKRAIQMKTGTYEDRLQAAFEDINFRITNLKEIPEIEYYDNDGYMFTIPPYDGAYDLNKWISRVMFDLDNLEFEFVGIDGTDLQVTFPDTEDISNAIISLNTFFYLHS